MQNKFTKTAENVLSAALEGARSLGHTYVGTEHILLGLLSEKNGIAYKILASRGMTYSTVKDAIAEGCGIGSCSNVTSNDLTRRAKEVIEESAYEALKYGQPYIGTEHILITLVCENDCTGAKIISQSGIRLSELFTDTVAFLDNGTPQVKPDTKEKKIKGRMPDVPTLRKYGKNLTEEAMSGKLDPLVGREVECDCVIKALLRRYKNNPCLIGEAGVGKTAVVEGIAQRISSGFVPEGLEGKVIFSLDLPAMLAGAKYRGEFEDRLKSVMNEVRKNPDIILFIDEIHTIAGAGAAEGAIDAANILKPALARGELHVIGATTTEEYRKIIEKDSALERRFCKINVSEPDEKLCKNILTALRPALQEHHKVKITDEAICAAISMSKRYIPDRYLPDKAIDLIDEACAAKHVKDNGEGDESHSYRERISKLCEKKDEAIRSGKFELAAQLRGSEQELRSEYERKQNEQRAEKTELPLVEVCDIAKIITLYTDIPADTVNTDEAIRLLTLEKELSKRIVGQKEAISSLSRAVRRGRVGLKNPNRPTGSFIFAGPSGVGKTELCRATAQVVFGDPEAIVRLDMSEYMEKHSVSRLTGAPPGYVGFEEGGQLTEKVRRRPYSVVLFDEIEKAHPDVMNILLQILDDGNLTDSFGRKISFKNCIVIMTSNVSSEKLKKVGFGENTESGCDTEALKKIFRPELLNRIDEIITFNPLGASELVEIAKSMLGELAERAEQIGIKTEFCDEVVEKIAEKCRKSSGARALRRIINECVEDTLASNFLEGKVCSGDSVRLICSQNNFDWEIKKQIVYT